MGNDVTRRSALLTALASAVLAAGFPIALHAESPVTLETFLALSRRLAGASDLDAGAGRALLGGLLATGKGEGVARLAAGAPGPGDKELAAAIVAAWYSGICDTVKGPAVATFDQALVWRALDFTKPFGACGGSTGYWSDPPQP